jgi:subtilisin family serine protease
VAVVFGFLSVVGAVASPDQPQTDNPSGLQLITLRPEADPDELLKEFGLQPRHRYLHALNGFAVALDARQIERLTHDPRVLAVEPDSRIYPCAQTNGSGVVRMGLPNFPVAHMNGKDNRIDVDVAVMDTGIQTDHPDLNVYQTAGFADIPPGNPGYNGADWTGHGTHVAGIIGALDNDFGMVGVAPGVRLWSVQVLGPLEAGWHNFLLGMDYIATNADKISVVNISIQGDASSYTAVHTAVSNLVNRGVVFVAAAGNDGNNIAGQDGVYGTGDDILPAALPEVITVSGMVSDTNAFNYDWIWSVSNFALSNKVPSLVNSPGAGIDVAAPAYEILSTWVGSSYATDTGTSMASPHTAGLVALYIAANGRAHSFQDVINIRQAIIDNSQSQSAWQPYAVSGWPPGTTGDPDGNREPLAYPSENWVPQPTITSVTNTRAGLELGFPAVPGYTYTVEYSDRLDSAALWHPLSDATGSGILATVTMTDTNPAPNRFYRLLRQPAP